ncbi:oligosaccharide repeat unit polymerase [Sulfurovum sp. XGS-02]|uniref:O-antigen polymerase n=1 Tax=Sulfurovum sp. XGS-02 TaxID=2925411 RepID=UPI00204ADF73|nr:O-antigen polymerase [Sulfurovum sp. XGS-02]UPT76870.1 oligosaccharide repeat unit polymerase [Sulfurovum sp. XGS-02]
MIEVTMLFIVEFSIFLSIYLYIFKNNIKNNLPLFYIITIMFAFMFLGPLYGYVNNIKSLFGNYLWDYYDDVLVYYILGISMFFIGYILSIKNTKKNKKINISLLKNIDKNFIRFGMLIGVLGYILWAVTSGRSIYNIFLLDYFGASNNLDNFMNIEKGNNYLRQMVEIFIPILTLSFFSNMKKKEIAIWTLIALIIYISQGFRYRIILLISAYTFIYIFFYVKSYKKFFMSTGLLLILTLYTVTQLTYYRWEIRANILGQEAKRVSSDYANETVLSTFGHYTRNYMPFASLVKYMEKNDIEYGYGETMFGHIFVRMLPSFFFPDGKPFPPAVKVSAESWESAEGKFAGEAYAATGGVYYEFGVIGIILFYIVIGYLIGILTKKIKKAKNSVHLAFYLTIIVSFFQLLTRGYLPGYVISFGYMLLPFIYIKFFKSALWNSKNV